jgi:hypothetical protein
MGCGHHDAALALALVVLAHAASAVEGGNPTASPSATPSSAPTEAGDFTTSVASTTHHVRSPAPPRSLAALTLSHPCAQRRACVGSCALGTRSTTLYLASSALLCCSVVEAMVGSSRSTLCHTRVIAIVRVPLCAMQQPVAAGQPWVCQVCFYSSGCYGCCYGCCCDCCHGGWSFLVRISVRLASGHGLWFSCGGYE